MTGEEKRQKMKEEYKRELQKRKEILDQAKKLRTSRNVNEAISNITGALNDDTDDWIEKLNQESAITEAKMDLFLEEESRTNDELEKLAQKAAEEKNAARDLLEGMKKEMGLLDEDEETDDADEILKDVLKDKPKKPRKSLGDI